MKKLVLIIALVSFCSMHTIKAQDTIVSWTFPTGTELDSNANGGIHANLYSIRSFGGTDALTFSKNGLTTKAAQATGWINGANSKGWEISLSAQGYKDIQLMSKQTSGGNNPGPRDFKIQYNINNSSWTDLANSTINVHNDWTSGVLSIGLPSVCNDELSIKIRWIMTTDTASDGSIIAANGISKIDDIYILGAKNNSTLDDVTKLESAIYPNPVINILHLKNIRQLALYNASGQLIKSYTFNQDQESIDLSDLQPGVYYSRMISFENKLLTKTFVKK